MISTISSCIQLSSTPSRFQAALDGASYRRQLFETYDMAFRERPEHHHGKSHTASTLTLSEVLSWHLVDEGRQHPLGIVKAAPTWKGDHDAHPVALLQKLQRLLDLQLQTTCQCGY